MVKIIPAILTSEEKELADLLSKCEGVVKKVQIDIIDGVFADNKTIDPAALEEIRTDLKLDYQLMVKEPIEWVEKCVRGQANTVIGHIEMMKSHKEFIDKIRTANREVGLSLDLNTPVERIGEDVYSKLNAILVMSVKAGFGGQEFDPSVLPKIKKLKALREKMGLSFRICVDGGITLGNIISVVKAGADEVCVGRRLFKGDLAENVKEFQKTALV